MLIHPLFQGIDERARLDLFADALGFDCEFARLDIDELSTIEIDSLQQDGNAFIENWKPKEPAGYVVAGKYITEDGPVAVFVMPRSTFARELLNASVTELHRQERKQAA